MVNREITLVDPASMGLALPEGWELGYHFRPCDVCFLLTAQVFDGSTLLAEAEVTLADEEVSDGDLRELCTEAVYDAMAQEGI